MMTNNYMKVSFEYWAPFVFATYGIRNRYSDRIKHSEEDFVISVKEILNISKHKQINNIHANKQMTIRDVYYYMWHTVFPLSRVFVHMTHSI